jgi:hypothetical protein
MVRSSGSTAVMTLPTNNDSATLPPQSHYQPAPYNFSRPHPPPGSAGSMHSGHTLNGGTPNSGGHIGVNGVLQGPNSSGVSRAPDYGPNGKAPSSSPPPLPAKMQNGNYDRDVRINAKQPATDGPHFPQHANGSASVKPSSNPASPRSSMGHHNPQQDSSVASTRLSPTTLPQGSSQAGPNSQLSPPQPGSIRQRHTLQVPKPQQGSRTSTPANGSDAVASGRFSPTSSSTPRRHSITLGRRPTRSIHSDNHLEEIPPDEDAARWTEAIKAKRASKKRKEEEIDDDKVVVGTKVDHNHVNWVTAYNMLTGIRFCVSRINAKMDRDLTDQDFEAKHKFSFDM